MSFDSLLILGIIFSFFNLSGYTFNIHGSGSDVHICTLKSEYKQTLGKCQQLYFKKKKKC
jgi:hypothetical protein